VMMPDDRRSGLERRQSERRRGRPSLTPGQASSSLADTCDTGTHEEIACSTSISTNRCAACRGAWQRPQRVAVLR